MADMSVSQGVESGARLLIVDDEASVRISTAEILRRRGFHVDEATSGPEALRWLGQAAFDLMILDMVMPGMSGVEVMRRARQAGLDLAIIVLTAHATVESAIAAVKSDVTDYMLKPCNTDDLIVTITRTLQERARQLRHQRLMDMVSEAMSALRTEEPAVGETRSTAPPVPAAPPAGDLLQMGVLALDREKRLVTVKTNPPRTVELTEGELSILVALMERPNQVLSCNQLADVALGYDGLDKWTIENMIRSSVFRLRQKIEAAPDHPHLICTVRGRGYFFSPA